MNAQINLYSTTSGYLVGVLALIERAALRAHLLVLLAPSGLGEHRAHLVLRQTRASELLREIQALDDLKLVADAHYAQAHQVLMEAGGDVSRVRSMVLDLGLAKDETLALLASFGPLLDAPVVDDLAHAETALMALQKAGLEVPIVLRNPLRQMLKSGGIQQTEAASSLFFLAGPITRRVRAIVDPKALDVRADWPASTILAARRQLSWPVRRGVVVVDARRGFSGL